MISKIVFLDYLDFITFLFRLRQLILSAIDRSHIALSDITLSGSLDAQSVDFNKHVYLPFFNQTVAGQLNGNLVYDPSSYIPRSGMLNATVNMFGKSINLFELGLSAKGMHPVCPYVTLL